MILSMVPAAQGNDPVTAVLACIALGVLAGVLFVLKNRNTRRK